MRRAIIFKRMKNLKYIIGVLLIFFFSNLSSQEVLNDYLEIAAKNNPGLKASFNEYLAAVEKVKEVGSLPDPNLVFAYFVRPVETRLGPQKLKFSISQMFPWFGTLKVRKDETAKLANAKLAIFEEAKSRLFLDVRSSYYDLYLIKSSILNTEANVKIIKVLREIVNIKIEAGLTSMTDGLRIVMELSDLENQLEMLRDKYQNVLVKFNNILGRDKYSEVDIPDILSNDVLKIQKEIILDSIKENNNQLRSIEFKQEALKDKEKLASKSGLPNISLGMEYITIGKNGSSIPDNGKDAIIFPKIGLNIPLNRKKYKSKVRQVYLLLESTENIKNDRLLVLENIFEKTYNEYRDADRRIVFYENQLLYAKKIMNIMESEYSSSEKNFEELLRMERQILKYFLELDRARTDKQTSIAFIQYMMGN